MYVPKVKYIEGGKLEGKLIDPKTKRQYLGEFVQDYKGKFYKGTRITSKSEPLSYVVKGAEEETRLKKLKFIYRKPTEKDYKLGYFTRYFIRDEVYNRVVELDKAKYTEIRSLRKPLLYKHHQLDWMIVGNPEDSYINEHRVFGVATLNTNLALEGAKILKGLDTQVLKNPLEFVRK